MSQVLGQADGARADGQRVRQAALAGRPATVPVRRRWGRTGAGVGLAVVGAWLFTALYLSAGDRVEVLALADDVGRFEVVERTDLRVVRLGGDAEVEWVTADRVDDVVGRVARVDLVSGGLLAEAQLLPAGAPLLADDEAVVGVLLGPAEGPTGVLRRGVPVLVVVRAAAGSGEDPDSVVGRVFATSAAAADGRERPVEIIVPRAEAEAVSAAAADRRVSVVALAG